MEAVLQRVRLEELVAGRGAEQKPRGPRANKVPQHAGKGRAQVDVPPTVSSLHVVLDDSPFGLLPDVKSAAVIGDVLANLKPKRLAGS